MTTPETAPAPARHDLWLDHHEVTRVVSLALAEDIGSGDITTIATVPADARCVARLRSRVAGVVAGLPVATEAFRQLDENLAFEAHVQDGAAVSPGDVLLTIHGAARPVLSAERVALNFVQRLSGIATLTQRYVAAVAGTEAIVVDTRKTTPGLRTLEKYAVRAGGGQNHRTGLYDGVLIKDNHLVAAGGITAAVRAARRHGSHLLRVEVEVDTLDQAREAVEAGADVILLDNFDATGLREAVEMIAGRAMTEASGGINLTTVRAAAEAGVTLISVGALTHSAPAIDVGLDFDFVIA
jgi:nicotinate-nucleotide pyrophosphorylase (carboxylating)